MPTLLLFVPFCLLVAAFAVFGARDLSGFFQVGPAGRRRYMLWLLAAVWLAGLVVIFYHWRPRSLNPGAWSIGQEPCWSAALLFTLLMAVMMGLAGSLRRRGSGRTFAVAWLTFREAMSQRAWLAVPLWLIGVLIVGIFIRPYRLVQDPMRLSTILLIRGQLLVAGVLMLTLGCRSIPRELDKRTIMVTASKPINMLELVLGKMLGFILLGGFLAGAMGICSYGVLWYKGQQVRREARLELQVQEQAYRENPGQVEPDKDLRDIVNRGVLYARDPVWPRDRLAFNGKFNDELDIWPCLKGGTNASIQWRFVDLPVSDTVPMLAMSFFVEPVPAEMSEGEGFDPSVPLTIKLKGVSTRDPRRKAEVEVSLSVSPIPLRLGSSTGPVGLSMGQGQLLDQTNWGQLYNIGPIVFSVQCETKGYYVYFTNESLYLSSGEAGRSKIYAPEIGRAKLVPKQFRGAYEISGVEVGQPSVAYWRFQDVDFSAFPAEENIRFEIRTYQEKSDIIKSHTVGLVRAMGVRPDGSKEFWPIAGQDDIAAVDSYSGDREQEKLLERDWPGWRQVVIQERKPTPVNLPRRLFAKKSEVYIFLACGTAESGIELAVKSGYLSRGSRGFWLNLVFCEAIVFMHLTVIAAVAVTASSFLSWPVACFLSIVIYLVGAAGGFLREQVTLWGEGAASVAHYVIQSLLIVLPDFSLYQATERIADGDLIPLGKLSLLLGFTLLWTGGSALLGYLLLRSRELAK